MTKHELQKELKKVKAELDTVKKAEIAPIATTQRGLESGIDRGDLVIPRASLIQALSPEMSDKEIKKQYPSIRIGSIINSLTKEPLGERMIPIFFYKNWARFNPRKKDDKNYDSSIEPGAMIWRSDDPLDPRVLAESVFGPNGEIPLAVTFMNFFSYFPGSSMPIILSLSKTSYATGKRLLSLAKFSAGDLFSKAYKLTSSMETNDIGTYAVFKIQPAGTVEPEEYAICEQLWKDFAQKVKNLQIHNEVAATEAVDPDWVGK
jgi:hypothetical protein